MCKNAVGRLSSASEMTYASIRFHVRRFHCIVPENESVCVGREGKYMDFLGGIITVKSGIEEDGNRFLSFVRSVRK